MNSNTTAATAATAALATLTKRANIPIREITKFKEDEENPRKKS